MWPSSGKLNLDRLSADSRGVGHHRCEVGQRKAGNQLMREAMGEHQAFGDAARNVGKQSQCAALVSCHATVLTARDNVQTPVITNVGAEPGHLTGTARIRERGERFRAPAPRERPQRAGL